MKPYDRTGTHNKHSVLTQKRYPELCRLIWQGYSRKEIAQMMNVSRQAIYRATHKYLEVEGVSLVDEFRANSARLGTIFRFLCDLGFTSKQITEYTGFSESTVALHKNRTHRMKMPETFVELSNIIVEIHTDGVIDRNFQTVPQGRYRVERLSQGFRLIPEIGGGNFLLFPGYMAGNSSLVGNLDIRSISKRYRTQGLFKKKE